MTSSVASSSSSAIIKSLTGAQIDIQELATNLTAATRAPQQMAIDARQTAADSKISAIGKIQASAKAFQNALADYGDPKAIQYQPTTSNSSVASFSFRSYYEPTEVDFSFKVTALATENRISFPSLASSGTFALKTSTGVVETSYQSLSELSSWIKTQTGFSTTILNSSDLVVSKGSGIVNNFTAYSSSPAITTVNGTSVSLTNLPSSGDLVLPGITNPISYSSLADLQTKVSQETGYSANLTGTTLDITFSASQSGDAKVYTSGLSSTGVDASIEANGQTYTSSSNRFSTLITGVNIDVNATSNTDVRLSTTRNTDKFILALKSIVDGYNELLSTVKKEMTYDPDVTKRGGLANDSVARDFLNQMRRLTTDTISGYSALVPSITLAQVGLITNRDGTLQLDTFKIDQIAQNNPEHLEAAVASNASSKGAIDKMKTLIDTVLGRASSFQTLYNTTNTTVKNKIQDDTDKLNEQMDALKQRYLTQFIAMQKVVLQSEKTQESLTNYMTSWTAGLKNG
jgi:flagellar hook-associated protein 2